MLVELTILSSNPNLDEHEQTRKDHLTYIKQILDQQEAERKAQLETEGMQTQAQKIQN